MLMFCNVNVYWSFVLRLLKLMLERAFVGHRFDKETPIAETVRVDLRLKYMV